MASGALWCAAVASRARSPPLDRSAVAIVGDCGHRRDAAELIRPVTEFPTTVPEDGDTYPAGRGVSTRAERRRYTVGMHLPE